MGGAAGTPRVPGRGGAHARREDGTCWRAGAVSMGAGGRAGPAGPGRARPHGALPGAVPVPAGAAPAAPRPGGGVGGAVLGRVR